ncbi:hypothetical protein MPER_01979, partial [Moniliophthora perniciosa FA553]
YESNPDDVFGAADTLIQRDSPVLMVSNFSKTPVVVGEGMLLGKCHNPDTWLDKVHRFSPSDIQAASNHAQLVRGMIEVPASASMVQSLSEVTSKAHRNASDPDDPTAEEPVEGGPKTAEVGIEEVPFSRLLEEVHISPDLTLDQRKAVENVILNNHTAFSLDGRLGNYASHVDIPMKPNAQPVSLPPFQQSPGNRDVLCTR